MLNEVHSAMDRAAARVRDELAAERAAQAAQQSSAAAAEVGDQHAQPIFGSQAWDVMSSASEDLLEQELLADLPAPCPHQEGADLMQSSAAAAVEDT